MNTFVSDEKTLAGPPVGLATVELLVSQPGADPVRFQLAEGKSTLGSSPSCQIRLSSTAVRPLQCLFVRKGKELTVTRWAAGVHLNGEDFATSSIRPGDVLSVGDVTLEVVTPTTSEIDDRHRELSPVALIDEVEAQVAAEVAKSDVLVPAVLATEDAAPTELARLHSANKHARQRFRRLVASLRQLRTEAHGLDQQVGTLTEQLHAAGQAHERLSAELHQSQAIATERESQIGEELDRAIAELTSSYARADATAQEITSLRERNQHIQEQIDTLTSELASLHQFCNSHETEKQQFETTLADRESQLAVVRGELDQLQQNYAASVTGLQSQNESLQNQLASVQGDREREVAELQQGLEASVVELHEQNETLRNQLGQLSAERDSQFAELHSENTSLRANLTGLADERDRQIAELHGLNESLREDATAIAADRDQRVAELNALSDLLRHELSTVAAERDHLLTELHSLGETLRHEATTITADRDRQIAELNARYDTLQTDLTAVIAERDHQLQDLRASMETSLRDLQSEAERLTVQLAERAAERERAIRGLDEAHQIALAEANRQIEALRQQLSEAAAERETQTATLQSELERVRHAAEEAERLSKLPDPEKIELENDLKEIRSERQKLAEEKHHLTIQLEDAEKRSKLLEIDVRSVNAEWQRAQSTISRLQDELITAQAHAADLDAKLCDFQCSVEIDRAVDCEGFAGDLDAVRKELLDREKLLAEAQLDSEQLRSRLLDSEHELGKKQEEVAQLRQQLAALQKASAQSEAARESLSAKLDESTAQIDFLNAEAREAEETHLVELAARDERISDLDAGSARARTEFEKLENTAAAQIAALSEELTTLKSASGDAGSERARLVTAISDCESRIKSLIATATDTQRSHAAELTDRDNRIVALGTELEIANKRLAESADESDPRLAELADMLAQCESKLATEVQSRNAILAEHEARFTELQETMTAQLAARDAKILELSNQQDHGRSDVGNDLSAQQQAYDDLRQQLLIARQDALEEIARREQKILELTRELHEVQDQLSDCAAQGERVAELYSQAQAELAAVTAATFAPAAPGLHIDANLGETASYDDGAAVAVPDMPRVDDPRDNDNPRLERALASLPAEPEVNESDTKTVPFQPASFIDRYSHIFDEGHEVEVPAPAPRASEPTRDLHDIAGDDSAALEAYMTNMMKRVRGETSSDAIVPPVSKESPAESATFSNPVARMNTLTQRVAVSEEDETTESLIDLHELKQSSQKPPLPTSLSAMRELANSSARQAIAKHRKRRHFEGALSKSLVSGIAGATAAYMLFTADDLLSPYFFAGCGVAVVSGYWSLKLLGILLEIIRDGINNEKAPAELDNSESPLPIDGISS